MCLSRKIFVALAIALLASCSPESSDEQHVRDMIDRAEQGAEARSLSDVMELVAEQYADSRGYDKQQIATYLRGYFLLNQSVHLLTRVESLEFPGDGLARARVTVGMLGNQGDAESWDLAADLYEFDLELAREGDDWKVRKADWRRAGE